jgi:recombination protein RecR
MKNYPPAMVRLVECLQGFPGVGETTAERLAFHILRSPESYAKELAAAATDARAHIRYCRRCFNLTEAALCDVCRQPGRDHTTVCVVESPRELLALERTGSYHGVYHVLLGRLSPSEGIGEGDLTIAALVNRCKAGRAGGARNERGEVSDEPPLPPIREVILATNPTLSGDATAMAVARALAPIGVAVTRLARGVPAGGQLDLLSGAVVGEALEGRQRISGPEAKAVPVVAAGVGAAAAPAAAAQKLVRPAAAPRAGGSV